MKFHKYLEQFLGSKASVSILRAFFEYRGRVFTVRRLAETAKISHTEANQTVSKLESLGIIKVQPVGKAYLLSLNEKSYILNNIVEPLFVAENKTLLTLVNILKKHLTTKKIISAVVFGSVARGEEREDSDIDLLVVSDNFDHAAGVVADAREEVALVFHSSLSPIIFDRKKFVAKKRDDLVQSILKSHIIITGMDLEKIR